MLKVYSFLNIILSHFISKFISPGYQHKDNPYHGATIGRVTNRIKDGRFQIDGETYNVSRNVNNYTLHGGFVGFNKVILLLFLILYMQIFNDHELFPILVFFKFPLTIEAFLSTKYYCHPSINFEETIQTKKLR